MSRDSTVSEVANYGVEDRG